MEQEREARIWQRVAGTREEGTLSGLRGMIRESGELAGAYRRAAENLTGPQRQLAVRLLALEQSVTASLRGIALLSGSPEEAVKQWIPAKGDLKAQLTGCYHRALRCQAEYMAHSLEPEYGSVYRQLAQRQESQCALLAELLGRLG